MELQSAVVDDVMGGVAEQVVREVLVSSVAKVEVGDQKSALRVRRADQTFVAAQDGVPSNVPRPECRPNFRRSTGRSPLKRPSSGVPTKLSSQHRGASLQTSLGSRVPTKLSSQHRGASLQTSLGSGAPTNLKKMPRLTRSRRMLKSYRLEVAYWRMQRKGLQQISDVLYHTQVRDGALPKGFEREFATLATVITAAAERERRRMANFGNVEAAVWLHEREKRKLVVEQVQQQTSAQFDWAAAERPRKYRSRLERMLFDGPTARRDAEEAERQRWLQILADLLRHSPTPMVNYWLLNLEMSKFWAEANAHRH